MARRSRKSLWSTSLKRTLGAMTRATLRSGTRLLIKAGTRAVQSAVGPVARRPASKPAPALAAHWITGVALAAGSARRYRLCRPPGPKATAPLPLLVMLHGCDQDAAGFAHSTRLQALAARAGWVLLFPEQERLANPHGCWNWFETRSGRAFTEAASIVAAIDQACALHGADPARVAIAGLSAGASMAGLIALHCPQHFKAVAMHSGVAPGAAHSRATALSAMQGRRTSQPLALQLPHPLAPNAVLPPLLVIQGSADPLVRPVNGRAAAQLWADVAGALPSAPRQVQRGKRHAMALTDFKRRGRLVATLCEVAGLGHAWSGGAAGSYADSHGPDASRLIMAFVARAFAHTTG